MSASIAKRKAASITAGDSVKRTRSLISFFTVKTNAGPPMKSEEPRVKAGQKQEETTCQSTATDVKTKEFDKNTWVTSLTDEQRQLLNLEINTLDETWLAALSTEITKPYFLNLKRFLVQEDQTDQKILPPADSVYSWSRLTPLDRVKVVIIGQDPYHNFNQAHGLAFSVMPPTPTPPSLRNMFIALKKDYPEFQAPKTGDLTKWAEQGVLLLNTCLTVRAHKANSHANKGWEQFTEKVISIVAEQRKQGVVFLAWGNPAGKRVEKINQNVHCVLKSVHPSPLSASRGFFDCGHFKKTNEWLVSHYDEAAAINWQL
ncbi:uracil-DNA glycosylase-like protein [Lipomyces arxii]|uniref:uracil-DNA glycosylase-like protein n=1 Tax=Lipomyces arxii TaxID=56418 RepID=UPI0034CD68B0